MRNYDTPDKLNEIFNMEREDVKREFSAYFYQYFKIYFNSPTYQKLYSKSCKHIFDITQAENKNVLDIGCGFGLISIHLAALGAQMVHAVDANEEKISILQKILSRFNPPLNNIEVKLSDALNLNYKDNYFDVIIANEIISHMRAPDTFICEMSRVLRQGGILYIKDGNNAMDIIGRRRRRNFWKGREYGPIDKTSIRGTEKPIPWVLVRREIIQEKYPQIDTHSLDFLAKETAGMYGDEICVAVEEYLRKGQISDNLPDFKFRDPITGEYNELEFNPYNLKRSLEKNDFSVEILRPYSPKRPPLTPKCILVNLAIDTIRALHPLSMVVAPHFEIKAVKK